MKKALFGLAESEAQAVSIFNQLLGAGFSDNDISVLFPDSDATRHFATSSTPRRLRARRPEPVAV
jgi:hypothetical protein